MKWVRAVSGFALLVSVPAFSSGVDSGGTSESAKGQVAAVADTSTADENDSLATLIDSELSELRGGDSLVITEQTLVAVTTGNVLNGNYTAGNVTLSDFSLSNFNGFGNLLINTGAQVSLQTGMNVTINVGN